MADRAENRNPDDLSEDAVPLESSQPPRFGERVELSPGASTVSFQRPDLGTQNSNLSARTASHQPARSSRSDASSQLRQMPQSQPSVQGGFSNRYRDYTQTQQRFPNQSGTSQSTSARAFPELPHSQVVPSSSAEIRPSPNSAKDDDDDGRLGLQNDVLKGVDIAVRSAVSDEGYASQSDPHSIPSSSLSPTTSKISPLDLPVKTGSLPPADEVDDVDKEIERYKHKFPRKLAVDYYDAMILYQEDDKKEVERFLYRVNTEVLLFKKHKPLLALYDEIAPQPGMSPVGQLDSILEYCTYVLLYVTRDFCNDLWTEFSSQTCLMDAIQTPDRRWSVVPIFTEPKRNTTFRVPPSVRSLKGIQYWSDDKFYVDSLRKLLEDKFEVRRKREVAHRNKRKIWILEEKGREQRAAEERRQEELHTRQKETALNEQHRLLSQARDQQHQLRMQEVGSQQSRFQLMNPQEFMKQHGYVGSPSQTPDSLKYMQSLYQPSTPGYDSKNPCGTQKPMSVPSDLDQWGTSHSAELSPSLQHSYSLPWYAGGDHFSLPASLSQDIKPMSSSVPSKSSGGLSQYSTMPQFSLDQQGYLDEQGTAEGAGNVASNKSQESSLRNDASQSAGSGDAQHGPGKSLHYYQSGSAENKDHLPMHASQVCPQSAGLRGNPDGSPLSSQRGQVGFSSIPGQPGDRLQVSRSLADGSIAACRSVPSVGGTLQSPTSSVEKEVTDAVQRDTSLSRQLAQGNVQGNAAGVTKHDDAGFVDLQQYMSKNNARKDDLTEDVPPESNQYQRQGYQSHSHMARTPHLGQPYLSEAVVERPLVAQGPGHASSRMRSDPDGRRSQHQYSAAGPEIIRPAGNLPQPQQFPQGYPYTMQPGYPYIQHAEEYYRQQPGYGVHPLPFPHPTGQMYISPEYPGVGHPGVGHPGVGHPGVGHPGVGYPGVGHPGVGHPGVGYPGALYPGFGYPNIYRPQWQPPAQQPRQQQQLLSEHQEPAVVHHHHYGEQVPTTTINYIKTANEVMVGNEITVQKRRQPPREHGVEPGYIQPLHHHEVDRNDSRSQLPFEGAPQSQSEMCGGPTSTGTLTVSGTEQNIASRLTQLTDTVSGDHRIQQQSVSSGYPALQYAHSDLITVGAQPSRPMPSRSSEIGAATHHAQGQELRDWEQNYLQNRETELKRIIVGPGSIMDNDGQQTDVKSQRPPP